MLFYKERKQRKTLHADVFLSETFPLVNLQERVMWYWALILIDKLR